MSQKKDNGDQKIPSIEELEHLYRDDIRQKADKNLRYKEEEENGNKDLFFNSFRRFEKETSKDIYLSKRKTNFYKIYKEYKDSEIKDKREEIEEIEKRIEYEKFFLSWEKRKAKKGSHGVSISNSATRYRVDSIKRLRNKLNKIIKNSPEAWEFYHRREFLNDLEINKKNDLIKVPYVENKKKKILDSLDAGVPVYLVGHLGSGKTQLALESALNFTIKNRIQEELEVEMEKWYLDNSNATEKDVVEEFSKLKEEKEIYYNDILNKGSEEEIRSIQPLFISGSYNLTYEDMFVEKTLVLEQSFSEGAFSDYLNIIIKDFYNWMDSHEKELKKMTDEEQLQLKIQIWKSFSDLLVARNSAFGTEVKKIEREILVAVKEGRPVIVDELNTIAMQNLIGLNDILQRHAGSTAYITGVGPVLIKQGFGFIGTGNLSSQGVNYEGTNELNPAFKSRFQTIEYNYVPQNTTGSLEEEDLPEKNELFRIILTILAEDDGSLRLPNPKRTLEELFRFSQLCKVTQNVFIGKWKEDDFKEGSVLEELELRESVLSIRNIIYVLNSWNKGEEKDLSKAIWDGFISSITYPDDQNYILSQAIRFGFFPEEEGWEIEIKAKGESKTTYEEIRSFKYNYEREDISTLSYLDLIYLIFGEESSRKSMPKKLYNDMGIGVDYEDKVGLREYKNLDNKISHLEHSKNLLEYLEYNKGEKLE
ncbi:MAG TPA: hypothetical protein VK087_03820 [Tissierellaceae bacterium]|nr:hypothetical protein [Tissierellaceae bacterium]